jgi:hypothetical protein
MAASTMRTWGHVGDASHNQRGRGKPFRGGVTRAKSPPATPGGFMKAGVIVH